MKVEPSRKRGRPKTQLLDRLRVVVWAHHVMLASGATSAEEFELRYAKARGKIRLSRGLWSRYLRGETLPQSAITRSDLSLVKRLDDEFPGTGGIFNHPVWPLLNFEQLLGPDDLLQGYIQLGKSVWPSFVNCNDQTDFSEPPQPGAFWSLTLPIRDRKQRLTQLSGLTGVAACLIEGRMGYLSQVEARFATSLLVSKRHFEQLSQTEPFNHRRAHVALLAMERYCITYWERISEDPSSGVSYSFLRQKKQEWHSDWQARCNTHLKGLSPSAQQDSTDWLKDASPNHPDRPGRTGRDPVR